MDPLFEVENGPVVTRRDRPGRPGGAAGSSPRGRAVDAAQLRAEVEGGLDAGALERAWRLTCARHPVLAASGGRPLVPEPPAGRTDARADPEFVVLDWRALPPAQTTGRLVVQAAEDRARGFSEAPACPARLTLIDLARDRQQLVLTFHHALMDIRSARQVVGELLSIHRALARKEMLELGSPAPPDPLVHAGSSPAGTPDEGATAFWTARIAGPDVPVTAAIHDAGDPTDADDLHELALSVQSTTGLRTLARAHAIGLHTLVQGAWALVLNRYSREASVRFGALHDTRPGAGAIDAGIGLHSRLLPLRVDIDPDATLVDWLQSIRAGWKALGPHRTATPASIRRCCGLPPDAPLFDTAVTYAVEGPRRIRRREGQPVPPRLWAAPASGLALQLSGFDGEQLRLQLRVDVRQVAGAAARRMLGHVAVVLEQMRRDARQRLRDLPLLSVQERNEQRGWQGGRCALPAEACIHHAVSAQAARAPMAVALVAGTREIRYGELDQQANRLAHHLLDLGVRRGTLVAVQLERSIEFAVALLAILKTGAAYVPLDPVYPEERRAFILKDTACAALITEAQRWPAPAGCPGRTVCLTQDAQAIAARSSAAPTTESWADDVANVIYTSGSTGQPKGVRVTHRGVVRLLFGMGEFSFHDRDTLLLLTPISFDVSTFEVWGTLAHGARGVILGDRVPTIDALAATMRRHQVSCLATTAALFNLVVDQDTRVFGTLRQIFVGGEALSVPHARRACAALPGLSVINSYGPTESAVITTTFAIRHPVDSEVGTVPIGRPIANTEVYILDDAGQLAPVGVAGELCIGGDGLADGYLNRPALTAERFVPNPHAGSPGQRMYRSGDLARWRVDGMIEFLGRIDDQVKIRGHRIEPGEVNAVLGEHPGVQLSAVVVREDRPGERELVGYVVPVDLQGGPSHRDLAGYMRSRLPAYLQPSAYVTLPSLPLTPNGKVDRKALPAPTPVQRASEASNTPPGTNTERTLAGLWQAVLRRDAIQADDHFFELGGHSLLAIEMIGLVRDALGVQLGVPEVYLHPTLRGLAALIDDQPHSSDAAVVRLKSGERLPAVYFVYAGPEEIRLAQAMRTDHAVFGIRAPWPRAWVEAAAARRLSALPDMQAYIEPYLQALEAHAGREPVVLLGHSLAGVMAAEIARRFEAGGGRVEAVLVLDAWAQKPNPYAYALRGLRRIWLGAPAAPDVRSPRTLGARLRDSLALLGWVRQQERKRLGERLAEGRAAWDLPTALTDADGKPVTLNAMHRLYHRVSASHRWRTLRARVVLFRAGVPDDLAPARALDPAMGWGKVCSSSVVMIDSRGDHSGMVTQHTGELAGQIDAVVKHLTPARPSEGGALGESPGTVRR